MQQITQTMKKQVRVVGTVCLCVSKEGFLSSQVFAEDHMQMGCAGNPFFFFILLKPAPLQMTCDNRVRGASDWFCGQHHLQFEEQPGSVFVWETRGNSVDTCFWQIKCKGSSSRCPANSFRVNFELTSGFHLATCWKSGPNQKNLEISVICSSQQFQGCFQSYCYGNLFNPQKKSCCKDNWRKAYK